MFIRKNVLNLALPIMIEQTFVMLLGVCNTMMAGHIGEEAVSAIGMVDTINMLFISFFAALSVGATVIVAQEVGKGEHKEANEIARQALVSGMIVSLIITIFLWIFRQDIINFLYGTADENVKIDAKLYIEFTLMTYPFIAIEQIANGNFTRLWGHKDTNVHNYIYECYKYNIRIHIDIWYKFFEYILFWNKRSSYCYSYCKSNRNYTNWIRIIQRK